MIPATFGSRPPASAKKCGACKKIIVRDPNPTPRKICGGSLKVNSEGESPWVCIKNLGFIVLVARSFQGCVWGCIWAADLPPVWYKPHGAAEELSWNSFPNTPSLGLVKFIKCEGSAFVFVYFFFKFNSLCFKQLPGSTGRYFLFYFISLSRRVAPPPPRLLEMSGFY